MWVNGADVEPTRAEPFHPGASVEDQTSGAPGK
jgi:hypothetical protein